MQEDIYKLPESVKSAYLELREDVAKSVDAPKKKALVLAEIDAAFLKVQEVMGAPRLPIPSRPWLSNSLVPLAFKLTSAPGFQTH